MILLVILYPFDYIEFLSKIEVTPLAISQGQTTPRQHWTPACAGVTNSIALQYRRESGWRVRAPAGFIAR